MSPTQSARTAQSPLPSPASRLREARRCLDDDSDLPEARLVPLVGELIARSWVRSRAAGLPSSGRMPGAPHASAAQLARAMHRQYELMSHAQPVMDYVGGHLAGTQSLLILADAHGMVLRTLGDDGFASRAERVALRPGAQWAEQYRGTNAIGTALAEGQPVVVHGAEHYLDRNGFLTCAAAPVIDPAGGLLGVFDISGDRRAHHPSAVGHTLGMARSAAGMVEHRLFDIWHAGSLRLRLHARPEGLGVLGEGLLALAEDGRLIGANSAGLALLGRSRQAIGQARLEDLLPLGLPTLLDWAQSGAAAPRVLTLPGGATLWLRAEGGRARGAALPMAVSNSVTSACLDAQAGPARPADALAALDTGDATLRAAIDRARRVLDKPIAVLLQGESGVGKEVFVRALHASAARLNGPLVAVNCAALPESLIEAELFGYRAGAFTGASRDGAPGRIREAHGGTLFLDEIGDMPLAMQARLLRVLQERQVLPLGGGKPVPVEFRLVCATHRQLRAEMDAGRFREDLYYRLNGLTLNLPPLRERQDLAGLVKRLLGEIAPGRALGVAPDLFASFERYRWPGNLRQLFNALNTACALLGDGELEIGWSHLPDDLAEDLSSQRRERSRPVPVDAGSDLREQSSRTVDRVVAEAQGNLSEAARRLGISRNTLYRKLKSAS